MGITITWDNAFEIAPADTDEYKYGANKIRQLKVAVRERAEVEHDWEATGKHSPGKTSVLYQGNSTEISALTGMSAGCIGYNTDLLQYVRYNGSSWVTINTIPTVAAGGTVDAITATFDPPLGTLANGLTVIVIAAGANTIINPTFAPNGLTAKTIVKGANQPLLAGDIPGADFPIILQYNSSLAKWILLNPAYVVASGLISGLFRNLVIQVTGNATLDIDATKVVLETSGGSVYPVSSVNLTVNTGAAGANGLDTGAIAADTWYYVFVIYNPTTGTTAGLISLSSTAPTLPSGYTYFSRFGSVITDASVHLIYTIQRGKTVQYINQGSGLPLLISGDSGSPATPTWTAVDISGTVPPTASKITVALSIYNEWAAVAPNNTYGARTNDQNAAPLRFHVNNSHNTKMGTFVIESTNIYYWSADTTDATTLNCVGWEENF